MWQHGNRCSIFSHSVLKVGYKQFNKSSKSIQSQDGRTLGEELVRILLCLPAGKLLER